MDNVGLGWVSSLGAGNAADTITSGLEVVWTKTPTQWNASAYLSSLWYNNFTLVTSPGGGHQWEALEGTQDYPNPFDNTTFRRATMLTSDLALRDDPAYAVITKRWLEHPEELETAFANAWFKLLHRDMGPVSRYHGPVRTASFPSITSNHD